MSRPSRPRSVAARSAGEDFPGGPGAPVPHDSVSAGTMSARSAPATSRAVSVTMRRISSTDGAEWIASDACVRRWSWAARSASDSAWRRICADLR